MTKCSVCSIDMLVKPFCRLYINGFVENYCEWCFGFKKRLRFRRIFLNDDEKFNSFVDKIKNA